MINLVVSGVYIDEDVSPLLAKLLRQKGIKAVSAHEVGMVQKKDIEHLNYATQQGMVMVVFNKKDYFKLAKGINHTGIIVCNQIPIGAYPKLSDEIIARLFSIVEWSRVIIWA